MYIHAEATSATWMPVASHFGQLQPASRQSAQHSSHSSPTFAILTPLCSRQDLVYLHIQSICLITKVDFRTAVCLKALSNLKIMKLDISQAGHLLAGDFPNIKWWKQCFAARHF